MRLIPLDRRALIEDGLHALKHELQRRAAPQGMDSFRAARHAPLSQQGGATTFLVNALLTSAPDPKEEAIGRGNANRVEGGSGLLVESPHGIGFWRFV